jgi:ferredoxin--NADP+ reductase
MSASRALRVLAQERIADSLRLLRIERDGVFRAGQVLGLRLPGPGAAHPPRLYSIASGEDEGFWEVLYSIEPEGYLTPRLAAMRPGDSLLVEGPEGAFSPGGMAKEGGAQPRAAPEGGPGEGQGPLAEVWAAGGTGIAPFVSAARSGRAGDILLLHAAAHPGLHYARDFLGRLLGPRYLPCSSAAGEGDPGIFPGRATALATSLLGLAGPGRGLEGASIPLPRSLLGLPWQLCGPTSFVVDLRELLISAGLPYALVRAEVYF